MTFKAMIEEQHPEPLEAYLGPADGEYCDLADPLGTGGPWGHAYRASPDSGPIYDPEPECHTDCPGF